jgi:hypothetical protein
VIVKTEDLCPSKLIIKPLIFMKVFSKKLILAIPLVVRISKQRMRFRKRNPQFESEKFPNIPL